jgi:hypothetical protein
VKARPWQRERFCSQRPTHRISRFAWQRGYGTFIKVPKQLSDVNQGLGVVPPTPPEDAFALQLISPMMREVAATFLPSPALGMQQDFLDPIARSATPQADRAEAGRR